MGKTSEAMKFHCTISSEIVLFSRSFVFTKIKGIYENNVYNKVF